MKMSVGCDLAYEVMDTTTFIFNVAVAQVPQHADLQETWSFEPDLPSDALTADFNNRYTRLVVPRGAFRLRYKASVDLRFTMDDPLDVPDRARRLTAKGLRLAAFRDGDAVVLTWRAKGHTCVLASRDLDVKRLLAFATWS